MAATLVSKYGWCVCGRGGDPECMNLMKRTGQAIQMQGKQSKEAKPGDSSRNRCSFGIKRIKIWGEKCVDG